MPHAFPLPPSDHSPSTELGVCKHSQPHYFIMKEVAGEGAIPSHCCQSGPQLPPMPLFIFPPRENSLSKFGSMGASHQPGDFSLKLLEFGYAQWKCILGFFLCFQWFSAQSSQDCQHSWALKAYKRGGNSAKQCGQGKVSAWKPRALP